MNTAQEPERPENSDTLAYLWREKGDGRRRLFYVGTSLGNYWI